MDPSQRFIRSDEYVVIRPSVLCYKGYDQQSGRQITWHEVFFASRLSAELLQAVSAHAKRIMGLKHDNLAALHDYWVNREAGCVYFISEEIASRSVVDSFMRDASLVRPRVVARWFSPVLEVLHYLHTQSPPVVHHKIQLSSIFVRSTSQSVKVALPLLVPFGLSMRFTISAGLPPECLFGEPTPESDIWCFGLAILEVITRQLPYAECRGPMALVQKLRAYERPASLALVTDPLAIDLISAGLQKPKLRPSARDLAAHPYFTKNLAADEDVPRPLTPPTHEMIVIFSGSSRASAPKLPLGAMSKSNPDLRQQAAGQRIPRTPSLK
jgi:WNK lysine deficient protein kinase